jgi:hypothetical protein
MVIEISSTDGDIYSSNNVAFVFRDLDIMVSLTPTEGYVTGNTYLTVGYSYFYDLNANTASCNFQ